MAMTPTNDHANVVCLKCDDDGYLDASTLSVPVFCDCAVGVAKSKERQ